MFPIYYDGNEYGRANLIRSGLYFKISCTCKIPTDALCKVYMETAGKTYNLGTCIRTGGIYKIDTKLPVKYIDEKDLRFSICPKYTESAQDFIAIDPNAPFPHFERLDMARMARRNNEIGIVFSE